MRLPGAAYLACLVLWPSAAVAQLPDLVQTAIGNPPANVILGDTLGTSETVQNQGGGFAVPSTTRFYLSLNTVKDSADVLLAGGRGVPELSAAGSNAGVSSVAIPFTPSPGAYYLLACADDLQTVTESNEANNCTASASQVVLGAGDTLLENQWNLKARTLEPAGANVRAAWSTSLGTGVVIGIVDDGLQHTHPDLQPNYAPALSFDFNQNDPDPAPTTGGDCGTADCHGTSVGGIAAARGGNNIGAAGAARSASLAGLRLTSAAISDEHIASALGHQPNAIHVLNNSWGPSDDGETIQGPGPMTEAAIASAATTGRGGLGRVILWAAGNGLQDSDNCNFDGFANNRFVIAVGALADSGGQAPYSESCSAMFVTAPSDGGSRGITTTDLTGSSGYSSPSADDYTSTFGGTSAAAPLVSGVVALMLQANPALTLRDVQHLLVRSSHRINPGNAGWTSARYPHHESFGFGLIDAAAAVAQAATWRTVLPEGAILPATRELNFAIPDNNATGRADSIAIASSYINFRVERVEVVFDATHTFRGDIEVTLTSPNGVVSHLATKRPFDAAADIEAWRFSSVRHWGESAAGSWTLRVTDREALDTGTWHSWTLRLYGTQPTAPATTAAPTDFDGDGRNDLTLYRAGSWQIQNVPAKQWGLAADVPVPGDYDGDRYAEAGVFRPSDGVWYIEGQAAVQWGWAADLPVPADYNGDGRSDIAVFRPGTGTWYVRGAAAVQFGLPGDIPVPGDYTGDGRADIAVYRPSDSTWYILGLGTFQFGLPADVPVPADYNGDRRTDIAIWRPATGEWLVRDQFSVQWGAPGDLPIGMDVDGDGRAELVVYRRESATWFSRDPLTTAVIVRQQGAPGSVPAMIRPWLARTVDGDMEGDRRADLTVLRPSSAQWFTRFVPERYVIQQQLGAPGDVPVAGDYRGIGWNQAAMYRPSDGTWRIAGGPTLQWGGAGDRPVPADYDGDGRTDVAVWRASTGMWQLLYSSLEYQGGQAFHWGLPGDVPLAGDYDGDRRADLAIFRPDTAVWYVLLSSTSFTSSLIVQWGLHADRTVPGDYDGDGRTDIAIWRPGDGTWYALLSTTDFASYVTAQWGFPDDEPVPADFNGDRRSDPAIYRPSDGTWYAFFQFVGVQWGLPGDIALPDVP
jgi:subtilisin-like proprotein convertase family protein